MPFFIFTWSPVVSIFPLGSMSNAILWLVWPGRGRSYKTSVVLRISQQDITLDTRQTVNN